MTAPKKDGATQSQLGKFLEAARERETDDREASFDEKLKKVAKARLAKEKPAN